MRFNLSGKTKRFSSRPLPSGVGVVAAKNIAAKANLAQELRDMTDDCYALVIVMKPIEDGTLMVKSTMYPPTDDEIICHGVYDYAARFLNFKTGNA